MAKLIVVNSAGEPFFEPIQVGEQGISAGGVKAMISSNWNGRLKLMLQNDILDDKTIIREGAVTVVKWSPLYQVVTWEHANSDGNSSGVADKLASGVTAVYSNNNAFAAWEDGGELVTCGRADRGGDSSAVADKLASGVTAVYGNDGAFAALKEGG